MPTARGVRWRGITLAAGAAIASATALSCASDRSDLGAIPLGDGTRALNALTQTLAAAHDARGSALVLPRGDALVRAPADASEDEQTRGHITSPGWRATKAQRFDQLGARLPDTADRALEVGASRFSSLALHVTLAESAAVPARLNEGRVVYERVLPSTDRVVVADTNALEEFLVLHDARAPRVFTWNIQLPEGIAAVRERDSDEGGGLAFEDAHGTAKLVMGALTAYDAKGALVPLHASWDAPTHTLRAALEAGGPALTYPVVIDPRYETSVWISSLSRLPSVRSQVAMDFDVARGEVVLFGGRGQTGLPTGDTWTYNAANGWARRFPSVSPSGREGPAMVYDSARRQMVLFGGFAQTAYLGDTWLWNGATWATPSSSPGTTPSGREGHAMVYDASRSLVMLFGGADASNPNLADTWTWDGGAWTAQTAGTPPPARFLHAMAYDAARSETILFGGISQTLNTKLNDTWVWRGPATGWSMLSPAAPPGKRGGHAMVYDAAASAVTMFGGYLNGANLGDTWTWNGATTTWTQRSPLVTVPARNSHAMAYDPTQGNTVLFGGNTTANGFGNLQDTWTWSSVQNTWTQRSPLTPGVRWGHAGAFDAARNEFVIFGGTNSSSLFSDTWAWSGSQNSWTRRSTSGPPARYRGVMSYDSARGRIVLFGGLNASNVSFSDTWLWDGTSWTQRTGTPTPPARASQLMAFDSVRNELIMYGGTTTNQLSSALGDTWAWNGNGWILRVASSLAGKRSQGAMAFDAASGTMVVFGGASDAQFLADTWTWDGRDSSWTQRTPAASPPLRYEHVMTSDDRHGEIVLFGGFDGSVSLADTWVWRSSTGNWAPRSTSVSPPPRAIASFGFDTTRGESVLYGGADSTGTALSDTWLHITLGGSCSSDAQCAGANAFCTDGVCCNVPRCGTCATCAGPSPGRCTDVVNGEDPDTCSFGAGKSCSKNGECLAALGTATTAASACASGFLVDGVCCETDHCDACQSCDGAKTVGKNTGRCDYVVEGSDPKSDCRDEGPDSCGKDGMCDGRGSCRVYSRGTACGNNLCVRNAATGQFCSGAGECLRTQDAVDCGVFACQDGQCRTSCAGDSDCAPLHRCEQGVCIIDRDAHCDGTDVVSSNGDRKSCGNYLCAGSTCPIACVNRLDCAADSDCDSTHQCVKSVTATGGGSGGNDSQPKGCAVNASGTGDAKSALGAFALAALVLAARRRRR